MKKISMILIVFIAGIFFSSCSLLNFTQQVDEQFGDQHFKTTISLIELHNVRHGEYPESLKDLEFIGDWDQIAVNAVEYKKHDEGYELNLIHGWVGKPKDLGLDENFWQGLGLIKSNMKTQSIPNQ